MHQIHSELLKRPVRVLVVGCGGNGSAILAGLPYLDQAMKVWGHPGGLQVTAMDGETVSPTNCARQPFTPAEVGLHKSIVLINRLNLFWNLNWAAAPRHFSEPRDLDGVDLVIGCADSRAARRAIAESCGGRERAISYYIDIGNNPSSGQFVLGEPWNWRNRRSSARLRTVGELLPEAIDISQPDDDEPSCSAAAALDAQEPFVNQVLAFHALALLTRLFRYGEIGYHGGFVNLRTGAVAPISVEPEVWRRIQRRCCRPK